VRVHWPCISWRIYRQRRAISPIDSSGMQEPVGMLAHYGIGLRSYW